MTAGAFRRVASPAWRFECVGGQRRYAKGDVGNPGVLVQRDICRGFARKFSIDRDKHPLVGFTSPVQADQRNHYPIIEEIVPCCSNEVLYAWGCQHWAY